MSNPGVLQGTWNQGDNKQSTQFQRNNSFYGQPRPSDNDDLDPGSPGYARQQRLSSTSLNRGLPGMSFSEQAMQGTGVPNLYNASSNFFMPRDIVNDLFLNIGQDGGDDGLEDAGDFNNMRRQ